MTFEKRREGQSSAHHSSGGREGGVACVHVAEVDLTLIGNGGSAEQRVIAVEDCHARTPRSASATAVQQPWSPPPKTPTCIGIA